MVRRLPVLVAALAALVLALPAAAQADDCVGADAVPAADNLALVGQATLCLLNQQRVAQGLAPLTENAALSRASADYSQLMVTQSFFDHQSPQGSLLVDRIRAVGYLANAGDWALGENIGWGQSQLSTARSLVNAWMNSAGHRENILTAQYTDVGLGLALGSPSDPTWGATYTTDFGTRGVTEQVVAQSRTVVNTVAKRKATSARCARAASTVKARKAGKRTVKARKGAGRNGCTTRATGRARR
ncbi:MAG: hypothetical protein QOC78_637 [Solirubrobacteraceae bacterium]|jgi:uncharacterized protein YkwD|nr:hypothetical protein [Solirubrobacteraceae bacterium]MEA2275677.1 hypothetical protein [Solirubrobacteraceae bacterium]